MKGYRSLMAAVLAGVCLSAGGAQASDEEIIALYEQSNQAWTEGRLDEAETALEAAWRQAEDEWGPSDDTAFLAEGLVLQRITRGDRAGAREPAMRVVELAESGAAPSIPLVEARLALAVVSLDPQAVSAEAQTALIEALRTADAAGVQTNQFMWRGWLDIARARRDAEEWEDAYDAGDRVINLMTLTGDVPDTARAEAAIIAGIAAIREDRFDDAYRAFQWAQELVPQFLEGGVDGEVNPTWATLAVWADLSSNVHYAKTGQRVAPAEDVFGLTGMANAAEGCDAQWERRQPAAYPSRELDRWLSGVVLLQYRLGPDGRPTDIEIAAEAPDPGTAFGELAAGAASRWQADTDTLDGCDGMKFQTAHHFILGP